MDRRGYSAAAGSSEEEPEFYKQGFEAVKQLTTLSAGAIVLIGTFIQNIFPSNPQTGALTTGPFIKWLVASSFVCLGLSLITSAFSMFVYAGGRRFLPLTKFMPPDVVRELRDVPEPPDFPEPPTEFTLVDPTPPGRLSIPDEQLEKAPQPTPEQRAEYEEYRRRLEESQEEQTLWEEKDEKRQDALTNARLKRYKFTIYFGVIPSFGAFILGLLCFGSAVLINLL